MTSFTEQDAAVAGARRRSSWALTAGVALVVLVVGCRQADPADSGDAPTRGKDLVRATSDALAAAQAFTFSTDEVHERVRSTGAVDTVRFSRETAIRRPDRAWTRAVGHDRDFEAWYDGDSITLLARGLKVWARAWVPPNLDEAMDYLATEYAVPMPMADFIYSSPYDAVITDQTTGGWVGTDTVGGQQCEEVSFQEPGVADWRLSVAGGDQRLPCRLQITYTQIEQQPKSTITFREWNLSPQLGDERFVPQVPEGFERIRVVRRRVEDETREVTDTGSSEPSAPADTSGVEG